MQDTCNTVWSAPKASAGRCTCLAVSVKTIVLQACCSDSQLCGIGIRLWSSQPKKRKTGRHRCQSSCFGSVEFSSHSGSSNIKTHATLTTEAVASRRINELQRLSSSHRTNQAATSSSQDTRDTDLGTVPISESVEDGDERMAGEVIMRKGVPVFVMLPLDTVWVFEDGGRLVSQLKREQSLDRGLETLRKAGVEGVMVDVWWGLTERSPGEYDFTAYAKLFEKIVGKGLKVQAVMSFHAAGGNVGDTCQVPLPQWVMEIGEANPDIWYTDSNLVRNHECLSLGCDEQPIFHGRTPVQMYFDFISAFSDTFRTLFGEYACLRIFHLL